MELRALVDGHEPLTALAEIWRGVVGHARYLPEQMRASIELARADAPWLDRCLAVVLVEGLLLRIEPDDRTAHHALLGAIGLASADDPRRVARRVVDEGYSSRALADFVPELRGRIGRLARIHRRATRPDASAAELRELVDLARQPCRLTLARYLLSADDVWRRILELLRTTRALGFPPPPDLTTPDQAERRRTLSALPGLERQLVERLVEDDRAYWVAPHTPEELDGLVEYPRGSAALVIKPPGSCTEIEIKRAGTRGPRAIDVVFERHGRAVPFSHRLQGGCHGGLLVSEAATSARFSHLYRLVHDTPAPLSTVVALSRLTEIPHGDRRPSLMRYLSDPEHYGPGFAAMREAIARSVAAFDRDDREPVPVHPGPTGLAGAFLTHTNPSQAILIDTSSFRLDGLAACLDGDDDGASWQRRVDIVLDELLGGFDSSVPRPSEAGDPTYATKILAEHRARADEIFVRLAAQAGTVWGTLLGVRGYTRGESFVGRNVGIRSVWRQGAWRVRLVFMDHDAMSLPGPDDDEPDLGRVLYGMFHDHQFLFDDREASTLPLLERIYRVTRPVAQRGKASLMVAATDAYQRTRATLQHHAEARALLPPHFATRHDELGALATLHASAPAGDDEARRRWLDDRGCRASFIERALTIAGPYQQLFIDLATLGRTLP